MSDLELHVQQPDLGKFVVLFELDATSLGGVLSRWTPGPFNDAPVMWNGNMYTPIPVEAEGFEWNGRGALPTPKFRINNVQDLVTAAIIDYDDLIGATVTRIRTFAKFLDDGEDPDPLAILPIDVYQIERKVAQNKNLVEWELSASLDQEGVMLPYRQVLRDTCTHRYRRWDPTINDFDYTDKTCPYVGGSYFNELGEPTIPQLDLCGKKLSDCKLRFGENGVLPTRAFPGVARIR